MRQTMAPDAAFAAEVEALLGGLNATGDGAPDLEDLAALTGAIRQMSPQAGAEVDRRLLQQVLTLRDDFANVRKGQARLKEIVEQLTAAPLHPALLLELTDTSEGQLAMVLLGSTRRVVTLDANLEPASLVPGGEVLLGPEQNVIVRRSPYETTPYGDTAVFERYLEDGRLALRWRDEQVLVSAAGPLRDMALAPGDPGALEPPGRPGARARAAVDEPQRVPRGDANAELR